MTKELIPTEAELVEKIARYFNKIIREAGYVELARDQNLQQLGYMDTETYRD